MHAYSYEALNDLNEATRGQVSAENVSEAIRQIEALGLRITSIQRVDVASKAEDTAAESTPKPISILLQGPINDDQQALTDKIAAVLEQREILIPAITAFAEEFPRGRLRLQLRQLVAHLRAGATAEEMSRSPRQMAFWLPLLAGDSDSPHFLSKLFAEATRKNERRSQWLKSMLYPVIVFLAALAVLLFLCLTVTPTFSDTFNEFGLTLPNMTRWLLAVTSVISRGPVVFVLVVFATAAAIYALFRLIGAWRLPGRLLNQLTAGNSRQLTTMARFTHRIAEALSAETGLPAALRIAGHAEGWGTLRQVALQLAQEAEQATFEIQNSRAARHLPATVVHALQAGPSGKPSIPLLRSLAEIYTARVQDRGDLASGFTAQLAVLGLGFIVLFAVLSLFLPLVSLVNNLSG